MNPIQIPTLALVCANALCPATVAETPAMLAPGAVAPRVTLGVRSGVMMVPSAPALSDDVVPDLEAIVPIAVAAGVAFGRWEVEGFAQLGAIYASNGGGFDFRLGPTVRKYYADENTDARVWTGASIGYEHLAYREIRADGGIAELQAGLDLRLGDHVHVGPCVGLGASLGAKTNQMHFAHGDVRDTSDTFAMLFGTLGVRGRFGF